MIENCTWTNWTDDSHCSKSCGFGDETGIKSQQRSKKTQEINGGTCENIFTRLMPCTTRKHCPGKLFELKVKRYDSRRVKLIMIRWSAKL